MLRNIEFTVFEPNLLDKAVNFNFEFSSLSYYYLLNLRKVKLPTCSYIKIGLVHEAKIAPITYERVNGILFISGILDFTHYLQLPRKEKLKFQYEMIHDILKNAFIEYKVDYQILDDINNVLANNDWEMRYEWIRKKINKTYLFKLVMLLDLDALTFVAEVTEGDKKNELFIFKSIPGFFVIEYLFKAFKIVDNKVRIGSKEKAVFEIDILNKNVTIIDKENKGIEMFEYGTCTNLMYTVHQTEFIEAEEKQWQKPS